MILKYYKVIENANEPKYGTESSACFDICCSLSGDEEIKIFNKDNFIRTEYPKVNLFTHSFTLYPGERALVPTNLIFDIPEGYSIRLHPRSGLSIKNGIALVNCEGVVDSDYVEPTFIPVFNVSDVPFTLNDGDRLCQGEIVPVIKTKFQQIQERPTQKTDRNGGIGSTGVS